MFRAKGFGCRYRNTNTIGISRDTNGSASVGCLNPQHEHGCNILGLYWG